MYIFFTQFKPTEIYILVVNMKNSDSIQTVTFTSCDIVNDVIVRKAIFKTQRDVSWLVFLR